MISHTLVALYMLLVILYAPQPGATQNFLSGEPDCAIPCLSSAINAAGCSETDLACVCGPAQSPIGNLAVNCLIASCPPSALPAVESIGDAACSQYSANGSGGASETDISTVTQASTMSTTAIFSSASVAPSVTPVVTSTISLAPSSPSLSPSSSTMTPHVPNSQSSSTSKTSHTSSIFSSTSSQASGPVTVTLSPATVTLNGTSQSSSSEATSASSASKSSLGGGAIAGIAIGAAIGVAGIAALLWFIFYRRRGTGSGVTQTAGISSENAELEGEQKTVPSELHGQYRPAELGPGGEWPAELGPGGGWMVHGAESGNR